MKKLLWIFICLTISFKLLPENINTNCLSPFEMQKDLFTQLNFNKTLDFKFNNDIKVAIIDTGLNSLNKYLMSNLSTSSGFGIDLVNDSNKPEDFHGHGSHIAGLILAINPKAKILPIKYYDPKISGNDNLANFENALELAIKNNVDIINISGGGPYPSNKESRLIKLAQKKGILIISAAGNEKDHLQRDIASNAYYPASYGTQNVITVMSNDKDKKKSKFSNWGNTIVDVSILGNKVKSYTKHRTASCHSFLNGTSQSTALITGIASLILSYNKDISYSEVKEILIKTSDKVSGFETFNKAGGIVNIEKALNHTINNYKLVNN